MGLSGKDKETIGEIIEGLKEATEALEDARADFRAIDAIDIALSLLEQQLEEDVEFIMTSDERPDVEETFESSDDNDSDEVVPVAAFSDDGEDEVEVENIEPVSLENLDFKFLTVEHIPSVDELESWFNMDSPEEDNI